MFQKALDFIKGHKEEIAKIGSITLGVVIGIVGGAVVDAVRDSNDPAGEVIDVTLKEDKPPFETK